MEDQLVLFRPLGAGPHRPRLQQRLGIGLGHLDRAMGVPSSADLRKQLKPADAVIRSRAPRELADHALTTGRRTEDRRVLLHDGRNPLPIDSISWTALELIGVSDEIVRHAIRECRVALWLLPSVSPFVVISHYDGKNIYSRQRSSRTLTLPRSSRFQVGYSIDGGASGARTVPKSGGDPKVRLNTDGVRR
jgi:hypothetical protein